MSALCLLCRLRLVRDSCLSCLAQYCRFSILLFRYAFWLFCVFFFYWNTKYLLQICWAEGDFVTKRCHWTRKKNKHIHPFIIHIDTIKIENQSNWCRHCWVDEPAGIWENFFSWSETICNPRISISIYQKCQSYSSVAPYFIVELTMSIYKTGNQLTWEKQTQTHSHTHMNISFESLTNEAIYMIE